MHVVIVMYSPGYTLNEAKDKLKLVSFDGEEIPFGALPWGPGQPEKLDGDCVYGEMDTNGIVKFHMDLCSRQRGFVCVYPSMKNSSMWH
jgi:hypothetical protein